MSTEVLFTEQQRFRQWWLWLIVSGVAGIAVVSTVKRIMDHAYHPGNYIALLILPGIMVLFAVLFFLCRLDTIIKSDGIDVRFYPFHLRFKHYPWSSITKAYTRLYAPLTEYGGWGLRFGVFGKGTAFNVSGNMGLQLEFINGSKLLIGTRKPEQINTVLHSLGQYRQ